MGKQQAPGKKRARPQGQGGDASQPKKEKKQKKKQQQASDEGEDVDFAALGFDDALAVGLAFAQLGAHDPACEAYARAVALQPRHFSAHCQLADALTETGDHAAARTHYAAASELDEAARDASLWLRLGMAQAAEELTDAALVSYDKARKLAQEQLLQSGEDGEDEDARRAYGMALAALAHVQGVERGDVGAAVRVYEDAVEAFPANANLRFNLATMRLASGDETRAIADLKRAIELDGNVAEFYEELAALLEAGEEKTAMENKAKELNQREGAKEQEEEEEGKDGEGEEEEEEEEESEEEEEEEEE